MDTEEPEWNGFRGADLTIVIPTLDSAKWLERVLLGHRRMLPDAEIVVVDDGSGPETLGLLERVTPPLNLTVVRHSVRRGQWRSTLDGCAAASSSTLLTIDDDVELRPDGLRMARAALAEGAGVAYLHSERVHEARWRALGSVAFRALARARGFPVEFAQATSTRLLPSSRLDRAGAVPLDVHLARQHARVAVVVGAVDKITDSSTRYNVPRLVSHACVHLSPSWRSRRR